MLRPLLALLVLVVGCDRHLTAAAFCGNPLEPTAFRVVRRATGAMLEDTTPRLVNRYLIPHRAQDTIPFRDENGMFKPGAFQILETPFGDAYCVTYLDSLIHHDERARLYFAVP